jgi:hypothetical protein
MIRPATLVCMLLAGASGLYLYQTKHRSQVLDRTIADTIKRTEQTRERIGMLKAEWALLNEPDRLADLVKAHTGLRTLAPTQFIALNDLAAKLPPPAAPAPPKAPTDVEPDEPPAPAVAQAAPPPAPKPATPARPTQLTLAASAPAVTEKPAEPKPQLAAAEPKAAKPARPVQLAAAAPAPVHAAVSAPVRPATPASMPAGVNSAAVAPGTIGESVLRAMRANAPSYAAPAPAAAYVQPAMASAPAYAAASGASLLGGSRSALPPPVPYVAR